MRHLAAFWYHRRRHPRESGHQIEEQSTAYFCHVYDCEHADMRRLYEQAKIDQWNAATDIDCPGCSNATAG